MRYLISLVCLSVFIFSAHRAPAQELTCPANMREQLTDFNSGDTFYGLINPAGTFIAFESFADVNGNNPENNEEIYLLNNVTGSIDQIAVLKL